MRTQVLMLLGALALAAGCGSEPPGPPAGPPEPVGSRSIQAIEPRDMAREVSRRPVFKWKLPAHLRAPRMVSFHLAAVGQAEDPHKAVAQEKPLAFASGLAPVSPTELDPFSPPSGAILTGDLRDMKQLKGDTWYHWRVRAIGNGDAAGADFFFRTRTEDAVPTPRP